MIMFGPLGLCKIWVWEGVYHDVQRAFAADDDLSYVWLGMWLWLWARRNVDVDCTDMSIEDVGRINSLQIEILKHVVT